LQSGETYLVVLYKGDYTMLGLSLGLKIKNKAGKGVTPPGSEIFTTNGTFIVPAGITSIDVFLVGGGGGGGSGGGGGGYTKTYKASEAGYRDGGAIVVVPGASWAVTVGAGGNAAADGGYSRFGDDATYQADGGKKGLAYNQPGGAGGSGGGGYFGGFYQSADYYATGGSDGNNGVRGYYTATVAAGQGNTTREFGEATGTIYAGGGGGGLDQAYNVAVHGLGGAGGGGKGNYSGGAADYSDATANTGGGGGGSGFANKGKGGSGIVIIRWG
jgi:hypothetical protein